MAKWPEVNYGTRRYAVLHHTGVDGSHFDFLFETSPDSPLVTFRLQQWPMTEGQPATKLRDHRRMYLTYEGPIPGDRGRVDRIAEGTVTVIETANGWMLRSLGGELFALFEPRGDESSEDWWAEPPPDPAGR